MVDDGGDGRTAYPPCTSFDPRENTLKSYDAVVVGAGPNGLAAALTLAHAGLRVLVREAAPLPGGGTRSEPLTLPGFLHDTCATAHPMAVVSPFFRAAALNRFGLDWVHSPAPVAHVLDQGAILLERDVHQTAGALGEDGAMYERLMAPFVENADALFAEILRPVGWPRQPRLMAKFGMKALLSATNLVRAHFRGERARALFAGLAAHSVIPLEYPGSAAVGIVLAVAGHVAGWPLARGGSVSIARALARALEAAGAEIECNARVDSLADLPQSSLVMLDVGPPAAAAIAGPAFPARYARQLRRYRYGPGAFKLDWALDGPIPWRATECLRAATVHVGGSLEEIAQSERDAWEGRVPERPFVLLCQASLFDDQRAPAGKHTAWAYCHVPHACLVDMTERIERRIEQFAPGFRDRILQRCARSPAALEQHNANLVGGDIIGGSNHIWQLMFRPVPGRHPYRTPSRGIYLCSASTPPGGGVHGMCGWNAALHALRDLRRL